jgi:hypothetical protein
MFSIMRDRLNASTGMPSESLDDLTRFESESIGSIQSSDMVSSSSDISHSDASSGGPTGTGLSFFDKIGLRRKSSIANSSIELRGYNPKKGVVKVLKAIKQMNSLMVAKIGLIAFLEMLQTCYHSHVSLTLLKSFMEHHRIMPKPLYFHYYIYFLHYAEYYHYIRSVADVIDPNKIEFHREWLSNIREHLKYIYHIISKQRTEISL